MKMMIVEAREIHWTDYFELTKPRITFLVAVTSAIGFLLGSIHRLDLLLFFNTVFGTILAAGGASALNMALEWDADSRMKRTENRPIPSGRLSVLQSVFFGSTMSIAGIFYLFFFVNFLTSILAAITIGLYLFAYTPLKKKSPICTVVGAVPGAIPPMMGWTGARNLLEFEAGWLFAILFLWQLPHFLSIAWLYREDYQRGGFLMLSVYDREGHRTSRHIIVQTFTLLLLSILPVWMGLFGQAYLVAAILLGLLFLAMGIRLAIQRSNEAARDVLLTSVLYLPLLLIFMVLDKNF